jgi:hypothetical protein
MAGLQALDHLVVRVGDDAFALSMASQPPSRTLPCLAVRALEATGLLATSAAVGT